MFWRMVTSVCTKDVILSFCRTHIKNDLFPVVLRGPTSLIPAQKCCEVDYFWKFQQEISKSGYFFSLITFWYTAKKSTGKQFTYTSKKSFFFFFSHGRASSLYAFSEYLNNSKILTVVNRCIYFGFFGEDLSSRGRCI